MADFGLYADMINSALAHYLSPDYFKGRESAGLGVMRDAMSYSLENGGKRIRPALTVEFCRICGGEPESALPFACAVEMVHTYSLIHDDLPCMDNDDMRRGKPSSHIRFGEADALLAGDALLTLAFEVVAGANLPADRIVRACACLAKAAGCSGMIAGQVMDLANEKTLASSEQIRETDLRKTGELIKAAAALGCIAAGAGSDKLSAADEFCKNLGLAFQIVDDILDVTSDEKTLGKPIGSDSKSEKSTYVSLLGLEGSKAMAEQLTQKAKAALTPFGEDGKALVRLADRLCGRGS